MKNFKLPGHSFPKVKGFKSTSKEDGRAASSAFQMKSPFREEDDKSTLGDPTWSSPELGEQEDKYNRTQQVGESGVDFGVRGLMEMSQRLRDKRKARKASKKLDDQTNKYNDPHVLDKAAEDARLAEEARLRAATDLKQYKGPVVKEIKANTIIKPTETKSYKVQSGDNLSKIAKANNMTLEELLEKNPEYKNKPSFVRSGATIKLN